MATLIVENVPAEVYDRLQQRAAAARRSLPEETLHLLQEALRENRHPAPRWPDFTSGAEISAPCDLPRSHPSAAVNARPGRPRLPDPFPEPLPESEQ